MKRIFTVAKLEDLEVVRMHEAGLLDEDFDMQLDKIKRGLIGHAIGVAMGAT